MRGAARIPCGLGDAVAALVLPDISVGMNIVCRAGRESFYPST
jgi:hypothetical protein